MKNISENNWIKNWQAKNDFLEKILSSNKNEIIEETKEYYLGLAEQAICIANKNKGSVNKVICHKRINDSNENNQIIDYKERDYGEYIKYLIFRKEKDIEYIKKYVDVVLTKNYSSDLIIARLMYPSEYFDLIDKYYNNIDINNDVKRLLSKERIRYEIINYINKKRGHPL